MSFIQALVRRLFNVAPAIVSRPVELSPGALKSVVGGNGSTDASPRNGW